MATTAPMTAEELWRLPDNSMRYELVAGELQMMSPAGWRHGELVFHLSMLIGQYVKQHRLGRCFGAETGFLIERNPDTVLAPDIAFVQASNLPTVEPQEVYWPGPPDLIVEVRSPQDRDSAVRAKAGRWLSAGGKLVWDVDPAQECVTVYSAVAEPTIVQSHESLCGDDVLDGFAVGVCEIFEDLETSNP